ncbi:MAG: hypothetical protein R6U19_05510 [Bacteroidales bacterium]
MGIFLILMHPGYTGNASASDSAFMAREDSLIRLRRSSLNAEEQFVRFNMNEKLIDYWFETLKIRGSEDYRFDRMDSMYMVTSADNKVRIVTWHILNDNLSYDFFGIVQAYSESRERYVVYELHDKTGRLDNPEYETLRNGEWIGSIYYDIIEVERSSGFFDRLFSSPKKYYTLLGWNGNDLKTDIKIIDVGRLQSNGGLVFGHPLFRTKDPRLRRIIFEYSSRAPMSMNYEKQYIRIEEKDKDSRKRQQGRARRKDPLQVSKVHQRDFSAQKRENQNQKKRSEPELEARKMIVFQRLIPLRPELEGIPSQIVPHPEDYAAFVFENGRWNYYDNIEAFNRPDPKYDKYQRNYDDNFNLFLR